MTSPTTNEAGAYPWEVDAGSIGQESTDSTTPEADRQRFAELLLGSEPGTVVELRAFMPAIVSGYFDDPVKLAEAAGRQDAARAEGVFVTMNPVLSGLIARRCNCVTPSKQTTNGEEIPRRVRLLIDIDPPRPSKISSTDKELECAFARAEEIAADLTEQGWPEPMMNLSGNGIHLLYGVDLPAKDDDLVKRVLAALAFRYDDEQAKIDKSVHDPNRIMRFPGTVARKGESLDARPGIDARPHRVARILRDPGVLLPVPAALLEELAATMPVEPAKEHRQDTHRNGHGTGHGTAYDVAGFIERNRLDVRREGAWSSGYRWVLAVCPWDSQHTDNSAFLIQHATGAVSAGCHHNGCIGRDWRDLREMFAHTEPGSTAGTSGSTSPPAGDGQAQAAEGRPRVVINQLEYHELFDAARNVLRADPTVAERAGLLVTVTEDPRGGPPRVKPLTRSAIRERLSRAVLWCTVKGDSPPAVAHPPQDVVVALADHRDEWPGFKVAAASALTERWPVERPNWRETPEPTRWILRQPGEVQTLNGCPWLPAGPGWLPAEVAGIVTAAGGVGKSFSMLQMAVSLAARRPWLDHFVVAEDAPSRTLILAGEENKNVVHRRIHSIGKVLGLNPDEWDAVEECVKVLPLHGASTPLLALDRAGAAEPTHHYEKLWDMLGAHAGDGWGVVMLDPLARLAGVPAESDNVLATRFVQMVEELCAAPGNPTVLVVGHSSKESRRQGKADSRGVTGIVDGFRWGATLTGKGKHRLELDVTKTSHAAPSDPIQLQRGERGVLRVMSADEVAQIDAATTTIKSAREAAKDAEHERRLENAIEKVVEIVRREGTCRSMRYIMAQIRGDGARGALKQEAVLAAVGRGLIVMEKIGTAHTFSLPDEPADEPAET